MEMADLIISPLSLQEVRDVYHDYMVHDFPRNERKTLRMIEEALERNEYQCFGIRQESAIAAYAFFVTIIRDGHTVLLFDYFAVRKDLRGSGIGSWFLRKLSSELLRDADIVLLEVDNPAFARDDDERSVRNRRLQFYLRNGLTDTGVRAWVFGVEYTILELPVRDRHSCDFSKETYEAIYHSILPQRIYSRMIKVR